MRAYEEFYNVFTPFSAFICVEVTVKLVN